MQPPFFSTTYNSFQKGPVVKDLRQIEVTVSWPGKDQEDIIQAVPLTKKKGVQIPYLVTPLSNPHFVSSTQPTEVGLPIVHFPSLFDPTHQTEEDMPVQRRSIDIGTVLGTSVLQSSRISSFSPSPGFSQGEDVMRKRKKGMEEDDEEEEGQELPPTEPLRKKSPSKKGKNKLARTFQKAARQISQKHKHRNDSKE